MALHCSIPHSHSCGTEPRHPLGTGVWNGDPERHAHLSLVEEGDDLVVEGLLPLGAGLAREGSLLFLHGAAPLEELRMEEESVGCLHPVMAGLVQLRQVVDVPGGEREREGGREGEQ